MSTPHPSRDLQPTFDDLGTPLSEVTFVVVDLETTGGSGDDQITEIGAVKIRGGEVEGEFQTLINPTSDIPPLIQALTGITNAMVLDAPRLAEVLPSWLEFSRDAVLVAHNAGFDVGFLKRACATHGHDWPGGHVVDTVALARCAMLRDEVPNHKLATLAAHFHATTTPNHRALSDARATVDVLHGLLERVGNLGVHTLEDLQEMTRRVSPARRAKRGWADTMPTGPGCYQFMNGDEVLYVGKSVNVRARVRSYFTAAESRRRIDEMVRVASGVRAVECATPLHAEVTELRLIEAHAPRYNRRSKFPRKVQWLKLTCEPFPRLSLVRRVADDGATYFGPLRSRQTAEDVMLALHEAFPIRQCTRRLSTRTPSGACVLAELGRCLAPCQLQGDLQDYASVVEQVREALTSDVRPVLVAARPRLQRLVAEERFEEAATVRSRLEAWSRSATRHHRVASLAAVAQIVAAERVGASWEIHVVRHGRLAGAAVARPGDDPRAVAEQATLLAEAVAEPVAPAPAATIEETERVAAWLERPGVRLIEIDGDWAWPLRAGLGEGDLARYALTAGDVELAS
ncbi:DEDD exonuclease domain-containing protein [Mariniluteicoccus endophyticus]